MCLDVKIDVRVWCFVMLCVIRPEVGRAGALELFNLLIQI